MYLHVLLCILNYLRGAGVDHRRYTGVDDDHRRYTAVMHQSVGNVQDVLSQKGGTCFYHAIGTVLRDAESRIIGRQLQPLQQIVDVLIAKYEDSNSLSKLSQESILKAECSERRLRYWKVTPVEARDALAHNRTLLLSFCLSKSEWVKFDLFFKTQPKRILIRSDLKVDEPEIQPERTGCHMVVIAGFENKWKETTYKGEGLLWNLYNMFDPGIKMFSRFNHIEGVWVIKNSWGQQWADNGFARIHTGVFRKDTHHLHHLGIMDVGFYESDLTSEDRQNYERARDRDEL